MGNFVINAATKSSPTKTGTILPDRGFKYSSILNQINEAHITISGMSTVKRELIEMGSEIYIYRKSVLKFRGIIDNYNSLEGGAVVIHASGFERWLAMENGAYASSPYSATASATIFTDIIGESTELGAGTIEAGTNIDFRASLTDSLWSATTNLIRKTTQDISMDYTTSPPEISILDHTGSATSVATLNAGIEMTDPRVTHAYPLGNKIIVYGKGDGTNQVKSDYPTHGRDVTSQTAYGIITRTIVDRSIMSQDEADLLADAELALTKDITKIYDFDIVNPDMSIVVGDHITLNAPDLDLTSEEVRVVGIDRGERQGKEYMTLQVTNPAYKQNIRKKNLVVAAINKRLQDSNAFMQGSTTNNVWGSGINAKTNYPLKVGFYVSPTFEDEAGNLLTNSLTVDYDIDKYKQQFGTASFTGSDPQVQNTSGTDSPLVAGNSGNTSPLVTGTSATATPTATAGVSVWNTLNETVTTALQGVGYVEENNVGSPSLYTSRGVTLASNSSGIGINVNLNFTFASGTTSAEGNQALANGSIRRYNVGESAAGNSSGWFYAWDSNYVATVVCGTHENIYSHTHGTHTHGDGSYQADSHLHDDGSFQAASHGHPDGSYDINAADIDHIAIGDDLGEAGSVNAVSVNLYLDFWNTGTSTWDNKHSVLATGKTLDNDVDISNSGTYPDATGFWRVRVEPITATADFAAGIVRLKYHLDS